MNLKTLVAVTDINNLSDARYCASMGVDILGFCLNEESAAYMQPTAVKEIAGWVSGVKIAGEFAKEPIELINELIESCGLHLVILAGTYLLDDISRITVPVIQKITVNKDTDESELISFFELYENQVRYFLITSNDFMAIDDTNTPFLADLALQFPLLLSFGVDKSNILAVLESINPAGIALKGGQEIKPGLKSFDELEEILEVLED